jgi:2-polyprenyl-3-methyl-5-hydroxy-6-metoxy-1,4-benzoquinol methylase/predicted RNA-binding Zn-ribbon protein involved in translation (DUF1610 family)
MVESTATTLTQSRPKQSLFSACPTCGSMDWTRAQRIRGASISRCESCGLLGTTDFLDGTATTQGKYETSPEHHAVYRNQYLPRRLSAYERAMPSLERFRETGRLLEIGCSYGYFLEIARRAGWCAEGVEISNYACKVAQSKGFKIYQGELQTLPLGGGSFDVIAMWDVIEHLTNPAEVVALSAELLRDGGALVARTPNGHALAIQGGLLGLAYKQFTYPANTREHVFHFTPERLSSLLRNGGFGQVEIDDYGGWEERIISGRNSIVRLGRNLIMRYALFRRWPYEFVITGVKGHASL